MARSAPDREAPVSLAQNSFSGGEFSPGLYGRQDLQKYASGCAVMRNFYVDARGGATVRPGTQFIGFPTTSGYCRLIPWAFSPDAGQSYVLVFSAGWIRFIKNPGTPSYPNSSNAGFVLSGGLPYAIGTPYVTEADLRALHVVQMADVMWIACRGHPRKKLSRYADDNWTLSDISSVPGIAAPVMTALVISDPPSGVSPAPKVETRYIYCVSAVSADGEESLPSEPMISDAGINLATVEGTVSLSWSPVVGAAYYKIWKGLPAHALRVPVPYQQFGYCGLSYGTAFVDTNIVADFTQSPIEASDPFAPGQITGYTITAAGSGYVPGATNITVTDPTGTGAVIYPVLSTNLSTSTGGIVGLAIHSPGRGYTAPTVTADGAGSGFAASLTLGPSTGLDPSAVGLFQQRLVYASTDNRPNAIFMSRPGSPDDFRKSNPTVDSDALNLEIFDQQVSRIFWLRSLPGGLLIGTNSSVVQLTGGSSTIGNPVAVSPTNAVIVPQSFYGSRDIMPVTVDNHVMFAQAEGLLRDLEYNAFSQTYQAKDVTVLSSHLFEGRGIVDWAWQDVPAKILWLVMDNGSLLSLTYLGDQQVYGWARHDTGGVYESVCAIKEGNETAVYFSIQRFGTRHIERVAGQVLEQDSDAWQLDSALSITSLYPMGDLQVMQPEGSAVVAESNMDVFLAADVGKHINAGPSRAVIVSVADYRHALINILREFPAEPLTGVPYPIPQGQWRMDPEISSVSGLNHLEGVTVYALVDGLAQGPFTVVGGAITLIKSGSQVVVGRNYLAQLQPLYVEPAGGGSVQGKRKKVAAASVRLRDAAGLRYGTAFDKLQDWREGLSSTDEQPHLPYRAKGLFSGDQRLWLDQVFGLGGWVCVQQDLPYPATVLSIYPEMAQGDVI